MPRARRLLLFLTLLAAPWAYAAAGAACTISATGVAFGSYDPQSGSVVDGAGTINVGCHPSDAAPTVSLSAGNSGTFAARTMLSGGNSLNYNLYTTSARNVVWGDGFGGSVTVTLSGGSVSGGVRSYTQSVFGRVPGSQNVAAGSYSDTITLTATF
ncbi:MAG TPA: spore coat U domain-containing protein [Allosphingosinicella sp.]|nr:spore coat U domain-containing protein [Allosphingosinicella sp.]